MAPENPLEGALGPDTDWIHFTVEVPEGAVAMELTMFGTVESTDDDLDLYLRLSGPPDLSLWNFRPYTSLSTESITVNANTVPALLPGVWYGAVHRYSGGGSFVVSVVYTMQTP